MYHANMTKVSSFSPEPKNLKIYFDNFWKAIALTKNKEEAKGLLEDLLTHTEIKMFAKRIQIAKMLIEGNDYQTIRGQVKVTSGTIAQVNNLLNTGGHGLKNIVERLV